MRFTCFTAAVLTFVLDQKKAAAISLESSKPATDLYDSELAQAQSNSWNDIFQSNLDALRSSGGAETAQA
jgi:hypothetical protein